MTTKIDLHSDGLKEYCKDKGWWSGQDPFNWCQVMSRASEEMLTSGNMRLSCGSQLLSDKTSDKMFSVHHMMEVLRDEGSGINRPGDSVTM